MPTPGAHATRRNMSAVNRGIWLITGGFRMVFILRQQVDLFSNAAFARHQGRAWPAIVAVGLAGTARSDSAGRFSDELDDTNYLSSDGFSLQGFLMRRAHVAVVRGVAVFGGRWSGGGKTIL